MTIVTCAAGMGRFPFRAYPVQPFGGAETIVTPAFFYQFQGVFFIQRKPFGLHIGACGATDVRALVPMDAQPGKDIVEVFDENFVIPGAVCILQAEYKPPPSGVGKKVIKQGGSYPSYMLQPRWGWRVTVSDNHAGTILIFSEKGNRLL
jgi:hypothetical protein